MTDLEYLVQLLEHGKNGETMAAGKAKAQSAITTIDRNELDSLILRVEHAIEHDLAIEAEDLRLLLQAIQTLAHRKKYQWCTSEKKVRHQKTSQKTSGKRRANSPNCRAP